MFEKTQTKIVDFARRVLNSEFVKAFTDEFLSRDRYLEIKLEEICSRCPLGDDGKRYSSVFPFDEENIEMCRRKYFGILLKSFIGKPGDTETDWLYSYLKKCESCLLSRMDNTPDCRIFPERKTSGARK